MKEQLFTIPVTDAFNSQCECPLCNLRKNLEDESIAYTMGPSYMEDDNRAQTDKLGFCQHHIEALYNQKNRLGLALMLKTHEDKVLKDLKELANKKNSSGGLFKKANSATPVFSYISQLENTCFICDRIEQIFPRYIHTIFHLWKKEESFREMFKNSKGFCTYHYGMLYEKAYSDLAKDQCSEFIDCLNNVFFTNTHRVNEDIEWFINKFDYRYDKEPWKNSKDAIPRAIIKANHTILD